MPNIPNSNTLPRKSNEYEYEHTLWQTQKSNGNGYEKGRINEQQKI